MELGAPAAAPSAAVASTTSAVEVKTESGDRQGAPSLETNADSTAPAAAESRAALAAGNAAPVEVTGAAAAATSALPAENSVKAGENEAVVDDEAANAVDEANASTSGAACAADNSGLSPAGAARRKQVSGDVAIPKGSVKRVIKLDKDVRLVSAEAVLAISKATEFFLEHLSAKAHDCSRSDADEPGTLKYRNVVSAQASEPNCDFLNDLFKYWQPGTEQ